MPTNSFTPQYTPDDYKFIGQLPLDQQRSFGRELLKQKYWNNLGVDYRPGYEHMDDSQTMGDRAAGVNERGKPDILALQHYQKEMEDDLKKPHDLAIPPPTTAMSIALQNKDPAMQALFSQPAPQLQRMAGDVITPNPALFGANIYTDKYWDRVSQPAGYNNPAAADAIARGVSGGNVRILSPQSK